MKESECIKRDGLKERENERGRKRKREKESERQGHGHVSFGPKQVYILSFLINRRIEGP